MCAEIQTVFHLLYKCRQAKSIWNIVESATGIDIHIMNLVLGSDNQNHNFLSTIIAFLIYKDWLVSNNNGEKRSSLLKTLLFMRREILFRYSIYTQLKWHHICGLLEKVMDKIQETLI